MWFRNGCVPGESGNNEPFLFSEFTFIKADQQKEENNSRKRPFITEERCVLHHCSIEK